MGFILIYNLISLNTTWKKDYFYKGAPEEYQKETMERKKTDPGTAGQNDCEDKLQMEKRKVEEEKTQAAEIPDLTTPQQTAEMQKQVIPSKEQKAVIQNQVATPQQKADIKNQAKAAQQEQRAISKEIVVDSYLWQERSKRLQKKQRKERYRCNLCMQRMPV